MGPTLAVPYPAVNPGMGASCRFPSVTASPYAAAPASGEHGHGDERFGPACCPGTSEPTCCACAECRNDLGRLLLEPPEVRARRGRSSPCIPCESATARVRTAPPSRVSIWSTSYWLDSRVRTEVTIRTRRISLQARVQAMSVGSDISAPKPLSSRAPSTASATEAASLTLTATARPAVASHNLCSGADRQSPGTRRADRASFAAARSGLPQGRPRVTWRRSHRLRHT